MDDTTPCHGVPRCELDGSPAAGLCDLGAGDLEMVSHGGGNLLRSIGNSMAHHCPCFHDRKKLPLEEQSAVLCVWAEE